MYVFDLQELEDATDGFSPSRLVGKGSHGSVYRGVLMDGSHVAVKKQSLALQDDSKLLNEAVILSSIHPHPCIINFLGITHHPNTLVTEYMSNGTLHHFLHSSTSPPPWPKRLEIALHLARALSCLHESKPPVVHRDVKSANVLFHADWKLKLADFGLAMRLHSGAEAKLPAGTIGYIDPSYTTPDKLSTEIDVFSYGVVLLELVAGRKAIDVNKSPSSIVEWALPLIEEGRVADICDKRVPLSSLYTRRVVKKLLDVACRCLSSKRSVRPSMNDVVAGLESLKPDPMDGWMGYVREMIVRMLRSRKSKMSGKSCRVIRTSNEHRERLSGVDVGGSNNISKGQLLIREILADVTF